MDSIALPQLAVDVLTVGLRGKRKTRGQALVVCVFICFFGNSM